MRIRDYTGTQLKGDLAAGLLTAVGLIAIAALPFGYVAVKNLILAARGRALELPWPELGATVLVVWGSYVVAGQLGALAFFLLRPVRAAMLGWLATGAAIAVVAYGVVGLSLAIFFDPAGRILLEDSTQEEAWALVRQTPWLGFVGVIGGAWQWWKAQPSGRR